MFFFAFTIFRLTKEGFAWKRQNIFKIISINPELHQYIFIQDILKCTIIYLSWIS